MPPVFGNAPLKTKTGQDEQTDKNRPGERSGGERTGRNESAKKGRESSQRECSGRNGPAGTGRQERASRSGPGRSPPPTKQTGVSGKQQPAAAERGGKAFKGRPPPLHCAAGWRFSKSRHSSSCGKALFLFWTVHGPFSLFGATKKRKWGWKGPAILIAVILPPARASTSPVPARASKSPSPARGKHPSSLVREKKPKFFYFIKNSSLHL